MHLPQTCTTDTKQQRHRRLPTFKKSMCKSEKTAPTLPLRFVPTRSKDATRRKDRTFGAPGIATSNKDATSKDGLNLSVLSYSPILLPGFVLGMPEVDEAPSALQFRQTSECPLRAMATRIEEAIATRLEAVAIRLNVYILKAFRLNKPSIPLD